MTDRGHPSNLELFEHVEGDLRTSAVAEHVERCERCAGVVRQLELAREALRSAPLLELPPKRLQQMVGELAHRDPRAPCLSVRRLIVVLTPVAAVLLAVAVLTDGTSRPGREERSAPPAQTSLAASDSAETLRAAAPVVATVVGPAQEVAALLRERGLDARVVDGSVEVTGADAEEVKRALGQRPAGDVPVTLR